MRQQKWRVTILVTDKPASDEDYLTSSSIEKEIERANLSAGIEMKIEKIELI